MKKWSIILAAATVASLIVGVQAFAEPYHTVQPVCADIVSHGGGFPTSANTDGDGMTGELGVYEFYDGANNCDTINFTMVVVTYSARTGARSSVASDTILGVSPTGHVAYFHVAIPLPSYKCVYFKSSTPRSIFGGTVFDVAPDNGCPLTLNLAPLAPPFPFNVMPPDDELVGDKSGFE
jgi:hypothetical protein